MVVVRKITNLSQRNETKNMRIFQWPRFKGSSFLTTDSIQLELTSATVVLFMKLKTYRKIIILSKH